MDGALDPPRPEVAAQLPGRVRGFVWPTEFLMLADFLEATPHSHSALQLMVGVEAPIRMDFGDGWIEVPGALVGTDVDHGLDGSAGLMGGGWIEAESRIGRRLTERYLSSRAWYEPTEGEARSIADRIAPCLDRSVTCSDAHRRWRRALEVLVPGAAEEPPVDDRIAAVLEHLRRTPTPPPSVEELMGIAHLSESRLQHLFRDQVGVPIRRYLLWHRVLSAMGAMADGATATDAAHAAGFSDSAHLSRTTRRMNGVTPSEMEPIGAWLSNCR